MLKLIARLRQQIREPMKFQSQCIHNVAPKAVEREVQEIRIPVPWGHIAGKWWGPQNVRPVLCLHGYQDNAGSWDTLAPLLPHDISLLAVDMPGHGLSSHIPPGNSYHIMDSILTIRRIANYYGWEKVSLLGHSLGSAQSFLYSAIYPDHVDLYIALDALKPPNIDPARSLKKQGQRLDEFLELASMDPSKQPSYTYEEAVDRLHKSIKHWASREACEVLTRRGTVRLADGRYCFSRDQRLKIAVDINFTRPYILTLAEKVKCKLLNIKALQGLKLEKLEEHEEFIEILKKSTELYEYQTVEGSHHVHLDYPERLAPIITNFLKHKC